MWIFKKDYENLLERIRKLEWATSGYEAERNRRALRQLEEKVDLLYKYFDVEISRVPAESKLVSKRS